jgi:hypothetical protein
MGGAGAKSTGVRLAIVLGATRSTVVLAGLELTIIMILSVVSAGCGSVVPLRNGNRLGHSP